MSDPIREVQDLGARLSEIDRKLREIQAELAPPGGGCAPESDHELELQPEPEPEPQPEPEREAETPLPPRGRSGPLAEALQHAPRFPPVVEDRLTRRIEELADVQADVLIALRELLGGFGLSLGQLPRAGASELTESDPSAGELTVSAGPFANIDAVRAFERELAGLPGVRTVAVRGYEGSDRAVIDIQLS